MTSREYKKLINKKTLILKSLETELFILIDDPEDPRPKVMQIEGGAIMLAFDCEEKLIDFAGDNSFFISMSGRRMIAQNVSIGIALNLSDNGEGYILTNEVIEWLMKNTQSDKEIIQRKTNEIASPSIVTERFVGFLDEALAASFGMADYAVLAPRQFILKQWHRQFKIDQRGLYSGKSR